MIQKKRIYDQYLADSDGKRILVDRLWPRGVKKSDAHVDDWAKALAPSNGLRKAWHQGDIDYSRFAQDYQKELSESDDAQAYCQKLLDWESQGTVTLLYAAKNQEENHVLVLMDYLDQFNKETEK
ncbi:DUF488 domain-containing protein [Aerococcus kribbianus]|uniref:DUF488 family protein n=1 Tax=Aerococcus kribbianus TaxID=2999064 RepID=A0A9X3FQ70_9LACT|nr:MULTISPECIES: DUF488 family protein [unclassified Aerococcus]MCZ0717541.1 DUF488 family protein [Aerococcus sp. YH-aer221]MCZ0725829.1 DUF488 family protein [Aerococcus sp. YH-aer222]